MAGSAAAASKIAAGKALARGTSEASKRSRGKKCMLLCVTD
jgi:hypothetical protein